MARLWVHEALRVFHDRLVSKAERDWFNGIIMEQLHRSFRLSWTRESVFEEGPLLFADFLRPGADEKLYEEVRDDKRLVKLLSDYQDELNMTTHTRMNLVFFKEAVEHLCRISRVLGQPRGSMLLIGVGGSGKQSLTRLAAFVAGFQCLQVEVTAGYGVSDFRDDLKSMLLAAGVEGKSLVLLLTDTQIVSEEFLEDVNCLLNSGEIPNLFDADEMDVVVTRMREVVEDNGMLVTRDECYQVFQTRVRDCLHVVLCMSPVGDALRLRCRRFPSLINCCTLNWFSEWPPSALLSVANRFLAKVSQVRDHDLRGKLASACTAVHTAVRAGCKRFQTELRRHVYVTPKSYLDLITAFAYLLRSKRDELSRQKQRFEAGVKRLNVSF